MRYVGVIIAVLVLLSACAPQARVTKIGDAPIRPVIQAPPEPLPVISNNVETQFADTPLSQWQQIVFNITQTNNFAFSVDHGIQNGAKFRFFNELGRIDYNKPKSLATGDIVDIVYFNTDTKRAAGFCRTHERTCKPYAGNRRSLVYQEFYYITPKDWVVKFQNVAPSEFVEKAQIINDRFTNKVVFKNSQLTTTLFIDSHTKFPVRVTEEAKSGAKSRYDYDDLSRGTVKAKDVFH